MNGTVSEVFAHIAQGDEDAVRRMRQVDERVGLARDASGTTAVQFAVYRRQPELAAHLWETVRPGDLPSAAAIGDMAAVREHLARGVDPNQLSDDGWTPLALAAAFAPAEVVRTLLAGGAQLEAVSRVLPGVRAVHAAAFGRNAGAMKELLEAGADPDAVQHGGFTPLHAVAQNGDLATAEVLLHHHAVRYVRCDAGKTAAELARDAGHPALADLLA